jgi:multidrug efflux pump subunit AcrA (membrane-fusion protein)
MNAFGASIWRSLLLVSAVTLVTGCGKETAGPAGRPPVDVTTIIVAQRDTPVSIEFVGQTQSSREVEIRARVEGFLEKRLYKEGELVQAGQPMFQMDRKPFEAAQTENALSLQLGRNPGPISRARNLDELRLPEVPAGLPSDLLDQRPDIRQAEEQLAATNARIGVARAAYFPTITLTRALGSASTSCRTCLAGPLGYGALAPES